MKFCDKLISLRREKGYSQEQLAMMLGVSRQSVSKWKAGASMPELSKILQLSELFHVSTDYLLKDSIEEQQESYSATTDDLNEITEAQMRILDKLERLEENERNAVKEYEYISERTLFGLPLVHIHFKWSKQPVVSSFVRASCVRMPGCYADFKTKAKGIVAIGNNATGLLGIGFLAKGVISLGLFSIGLFSLGIISLGLLTLGIIALGALAAGVVSIGYIAIGVSAIGIYGTGVAVIAKNAATGVSAVARTALGTQDADGTYSLILGEFAKRQAAADFLLKHQPGIPGWVLSILTWLWR